MVANHASSHGFAVRIVVFECVILMIKSHLTPFVVETVGREFYFLWLVFAFFGDFLCWGGARGTAKNEKRGHAYQNDETDE